MSDLPDRSSGQQNAAWTLTLRALPTPPGRPHVEPVLRLRAALKRLLRDHGLHAVSVAPAADAGRGTPTPEPKGAADAA